jgi:hypothetical protein
LMENEFGPRGIFCCATVSLDIWFQVASGFAAGADRFGRPHALFVASL